MASERVASFYVFTVVPAAVGGLAGWLIGSGASYAWVLIAWVVVWVAGLAWVAADG